MKLVIGGAFQGKSDFVKSTFEVTPVKCNRKEAFQVSCIRGFQELVRDVLAEEGNPLEFVRELMEKNPDVIIISDEVGCGIVPLEKSDRIWREQVGRCLCVLAKHAEKVIRVYAGIPEEIK